MRNRTLTALKSIRIRELGPGRKICSVAAWRCAALVTTACTMLAIATPKGVLAMSSSGQPAGDHGLPQQSVTACKADVVQRFVVQFVRAFNLGDRAALRRMIASPDYFTWYTIDDPARRFQADLYERGKVLEYFVRRHAARERMRLTSFRFNGNSGAFGHFEYRLVRSARGLSPTKYQGKGAARCERDAATLAVWSMGRS